MATPNQTPTDREIDHLFELPPESFIAARDELAKRLKAEGRTEEAARVRSLRRPTVAAWAANQVARRNPKELGELLEAGSALRQAQRKVLSGVKAGGFRESMDRRRKVVSALTKAAERFLAEGGKGSPAVIESIESTFEAASLDEEAADQLRAGRLSKELPAPSGFGATGGLELVAGEEPAEERPARAGRGRDAAREAKELATTAAQARRAAIKARGEADRLESKAERLRQESEAARVEAREASKRARDAETEAGRAQAEADRAARRLQD